MLSYTYASLRDAVLGRRHIRVGKPVRLARPDVTVPLDRVVGAEVAVRRRQIPAHPVDRDGRRLLVALAAARLLLLEVHTEAELLQGIGIDHLARLGEAEPPVLALKDQLEELLSKTFPIFERILVLVRISKIHTTQIMTVPKKREKLSLKGSFWTQKPL